jgi:dihydroorotate dehydrogenase
MSFFKITKFCLEDPTIPKNFLLSNAAGWDKDAKIGNDFFQYLGFQRVVLGSVTSEKHAGNDAFIRTKKFPKQKSMLNWLGLPNEGAKALAEKLAKKNYQLPLTINIAPYPKAPKPLASIVKSMEILQNYGDRWEINISCPNTKEQKSWELLAEIVSKISQKKYGRELYWKISPEWQQAELTKFLKICDSHHFTGFVAGNSSRLHSKKPHPNWKGGLSGKLLFPQSYKLVENLQGLIQKQYSHKNWKIIACGGISCNRELKQYKERFGITEFQIYTAFIFEGPKIIKKLQNDKPHY